MTPPGSTARARSPSSSPPCPWKYHHGNAVLRADDDRVRAEERTELRRERCQAVRLDAEKHDVGVPIVGEIAGRPAGGPRNRRPGFDTRSPRSCIAAQMRAAREQHDVGAGARQTRADVSADRARAGDDDLHERRAA